MDLYRITTTALDGAQAVNDIDLPDLETARLVSFKMALQKTPAVQLHIVRGGPPELIGTWKWRDGQSAAWIDAGQLL